MSNSKVSGKITRIDCFPGYYIFEKFFALSAFYIDEHFLLTIEENDRPIGIMLEGFYKHISVRTYRHQDNPDVVFFQLGTYPFTNFSVIVFLFSYPGTLDRRATKHNIRPDIVGLTVISCLGAAVHK